MRDGWFGLLLGVVVFGAALECCADQFAGKLQRVGIDTVTVVGSDNRTVVMQVESGQRRQAAPYIGKSVTVDFRNERGQCRAIGFRSPQQRR
ncbi:MAG: hypothetical protein RDU20_02815 [Desulfomonilaceae bacterium]|nr:hypothetical protein [Desulfomonilaceae bacterium]